MIIDCDGCLARGPACQDCVVTVLLGPEGERHGAAPAVAGEPGRFPAPVLVAGPRLPVRGSGRVDLDAAEQAAIGVLARSGLVPPLRAVPAPVDAADGPPPDRRGGARPSAHAG